MLLLGGRRAIDIEDPFTGPGGTSLTSGGYVTPVGRRRWVRLGLATWSLQTGFAYPSNLFEDRAMIVVNAHTPDVDVKINVSSGGGDALYARVVDRGTWLRARVRTWQTTQTTGYYEYLWRHYYRRYSTDNFDDGYTSHEASPNPLTEWGSYSQAPFFPSLVTHTHKITVYPWVNTSGSLGDPVTETRTHTHLADGSPTRGESRFIETGTETVTNKAVYVERSDAGAVKTLAVWTGAPTTLRFILDGPLVKFLNTQLIGADPVITLTESAPLRGTLFGPGRAVSGLNGSAVNNFTLTPV